MLILNLCKDIQLKKRLNVSPESLQLKYVIEMSRMFNKHGMTLLNQGKHVECQKLFELIFTTLKK